MECEGRKAAAGGGGLEGGAGVGLGDGERGGRAGKRGC